MATYSFFVADFVEPYQVLFSEAFQCAFIALKHGEQNFIVRHEAALDQQAHGGPELFVTPRICGRAWCKLAAETFRTNFSFGFIFEQFQCT